LKKQFEKKIFNII